LGTLSYQEARQAYDRIGSLQDSQAFYEDRSTALLIRHGEFTTAESVFEFGCGTGRFALRLLEDYLSPTARYRGVDVSPKMVRLRPMTKPFKARHALLVPVPNIARGLKLEPQRLE